MKLRISWHGKHEKIMRLINIRASHIIILWLFDPSFLFFPLLDRRNTKEGLLCYPYPTMNEPVSFFGVVSCWDWFYFCKSLSEFWSAICGGWMLMGGFCWWRRHVYADPPQMLIKRLVLYFLFLFCFPF